MNMSRTLLVRLAVLFALVVAIALLPSPPIGAWLEALSDWALANPVEGVVVYLLACVAAGILMTPGWIAMTLAGFLFGLGKGVVLGTVGIVMGATAAFVAGRFLMRSWVERRIHGSRRLKAIDRALEDNAFTIVVLTRLALLIPYNILNYAYGLTRVRIGTYIVATGVGMLPAVLLYVYVGTLARDIGQILAGGGTPPAGRWWIAGFALAAIIAATLVIHRSASRVLEAEMADESGNEEPIEQGNE